MMDWGSSHAERLHQPPAREDPPIHFQGKNPAMGPDVLVSNLWVLRDFWQWMFPGHAKSAQDPRAFRSMYARVIMPREHLATCTFE